MLKISVVLCGAASLLLSSFAFSESVITPLTPQTVEYQVKYGDVDLGKARFQLEKSAQQYQYIFDSALSLLVLTDVRHAVSEFNVQDGKIHPTRFFHNRKGFGPDFQEQIVFLPEQKSIVSRYKDKKKKFQYTKDIWDVLSVQMQLRLDLAKKKQILKYDVVRSNKEDDIELATLGGEKLTVGSKTFDTIKLEIVRDAEKRKKRQTYVWVAPKYGFLPIKVQHVKKGSNQFQLFLKSAQYLGESPIVTIPNTAKPKG
ncbi:DUF3108 domain-containing protein [Parashewanella curva]|uniref:DUF3108 domain-containing protein n=1 Tax=Parashewanella curva TaxID=2338552 RepID=A0A3L8PUY5_9GAMM|nr:DUF3108 domain-containing protein [Parashewanella curva]RLV58649.1 DUF3108 domain-containing protein [Parashewanella curva]